MGHMQVCTSLQTDNHASTPPLEFFTGRMRFMSLNQQRQRKGIWPVKKLSRGVLAWLSGNLLEIISADLLDTLKEKALYE